MAPERTRGTDIISSLNILKHTLLFVLSPCNITRHRNGQKRHRKISNVLDCICNLVGCDVTTKMSVILNNVLHVLDVLTTLT
jgi:hypothetical protein